MDRPGGRPAVASYCSETAFEICAAPFSRCTGFPWSRDVPSIFPDHGGRFRVIRLYEPGGQIIGSLTADEAVELVASHLPADCGPAIDGTPDVLGPLS
ncbi:DUF6193 family natural product biosynthesis protein [Kitasatospora sp. NPDC101801]|uniref:DUF6193 family natural product biosynthesis protein n=1 Tax=Kitasatospora sp. NPDC101801 TaxID=3364103 RepID=UPI0037F90317